MSNLSNLKFNVSLQKQENIFNLTNRFLKGNLNYLNNPLTKNQSFTLTSTTLPLFNEDLYTDSKLLTINNFSIYDNEQEVDALDDSYIGIKFLNYIHHLNYSNILNSNLNNNSPLSYTQVLNMFRANYEENYLGLDENLNINQSNKVNTLLYNDIRSTNFIKLRSTAKNAIVTFNAIQKVYRPRFDEGRSNVRLSDVSNSFIKNTFISDNRLPYDSLLGKNKESFFSTVFYKNYLDSKYSVLNPILTSSSVYFANIPFLLSMQSDSSRHL
jgi:hypothetical protein